ncbi:hypothetical protein C497_06884 [Halalkalicoccus jeotgali B3]|uniref:Uncharacterized protein n=1 Tax=Halalkalicoccus jeotgali (strain DSM 18796 / CECT 7217 / JCM 14584 / KCTC 4019 / B3) TaxID=795797 RepID=D8JC11_HALJB|nr:hypothetical protein HacjB3_17878 [Halalkalicoccus jeotgali B3]ELY38645.1 hypothetical protein C497_06884 [Halalkalicoccus jeotgali B3]
MFAHESGRRRESDSEPSRETLEPEKHRKAVAVGLHYRDLPTLADAGLVECGRWRATIRDTSNGPMEKSFENVTRDAKSGATVGRTESATHRHEVTYPSDGHGGQQ